MREVFNETGYERWTAEAITGSLTAHEAKEFHTIVTVYNVQPVSTSIERNMLTAKPTTTAEALTAVGPQRRSDRGDMVLTYPLKVSNNGRTHGVLNEGDPAYPVDTSRSGAVAQVLAYSVDKERGIPNSEGIRVQEMSVSSTITADGDPTERTDRGMRVVGPTSQGVGQVRRLTPTECERLQGFPDSWTVVDPAAVKAMKARWAA